MASLRCQLIAGAAGVASTWVRSAASPRSNAAPASPESADSAFENEVSRIMQELTSGSATAPSNESLIDQAASEYFNQLIDFEALIEPTEDVTAVDGDNEAVSE